MKYKVKEPNVNKEWHFSFSKLLVADKLKMKLTRMKNLYPTYTVKIVFENLCTHSLITNFDKKISTLITNLVSYRSIEISLHQ